MEVIKDQLKKYILGEITDDKDRLEIEERLLTESAYFEELSITEDELIQDFVEKKLDSAERTKFEKRFLISKENRERVKFARAMRQIVVEDEDKNQAKTEDKPETKSNFFDSLKAFFSTPVPIVGTILFLLGVSALLFWQISTPDRPESLLAFNEAFRNSRPIESRITELDYAPFQQTRGNESENFNKEELNRAKLYALEDLKNNRTAENLHIVGKISLAEKNFDEAIDYFQQSLKLSPNNAKLHNDLGTAWLEKGKSNDDNLRFLAASLEEFNKAIELNKGLKEAYFNKALSLQLMNLPNQTKEAWQEYLKMDDSSDWAKEAKKNLQNLESVKNISKTKDEIRTDFLNAFQKDDKEIAWQILSRNREIVKGKLIPQQLAFLFIEAKSDDDAEADKYLNALKYAGDLEKKKANDPYWKEIADFYANISKDKIPENKLPRSKLTGY